MFELLSSFKRNGSELPLIGNYWRLPLTDRLVPLEKIVTIHGCCTKNIDVTFQERCCITFPHMHGTSSAILIWDTRKNEKNDTDQINKYNRYVKRKKVSPNEKRGIILFLIIT